MAAPELVLASRAGVVHAVSTANAVMHATEGPRESTASMAFLLLKLAT
jgi:hypothetical protein